MSSGNLTSFHSQASLIVYNSVGVPIFVRNYGLETISLPILGLFSAIYSSSTSHMQIPISEMISKIDLSQKERMMKTPLESLAKLSFKMFNQSYLLVLVHCGGLLSGINISHLLNLIFHLFIIILGADQLKIPEGIEKELKVFYSLSFEIKYQYHIHFSASISIG